MSHSPERATGAGCRLIEYLSRMSQRIYTDGDADDEIAALEHLHTQGSATTNDLIRLGNLYYNSKRDFGRAIQVYRYAASIEPSAVVFYNLGLALSRPEVSQDLDAADAFCRALKNTPDYALAKKQLDATATKLIPLMQRARKEAEGLLSPEHYFQFYIDPIRLLRLDSAIDADRDAAKKIQRATKYLLHEIDLNDGLVSWMENLAIDKSRALALVDELHDDMRLCFHAIVHRNESLCRFLTHGDIQHFLYSEARSLDEVWEALDDDTLEFRELLNKPFARQYDFVLSRAIDQRKLAVIEALFDGRRWVEPEDEDVCFRGAMQCVRAVVQEANARKATNGRQSLQALQSWLDDGAIVEIFNLLPTAYFRDEQVQLVRIIREMAVDCWNNHSDSELSAAVLSLCKRFRFKSAELNNQLEKDLAAVTTILNETREHSFSAEVRRGIPVSITSTGAELDGVRLGPDEVEAIRWGEYVRTVNGIESEHDFCIGIRGQSRAIEIRWGKRSIFQAVGDVFRKRGEICPIDQLGTADQQQMFRKAINAALHFLMPSLLSKLVERLRGGGSIGVGHCRLSARGIAFQAGLLRATDWLIPWSQAIATIRNGQMVVADRRRSKATTAMSIMETDNAVLLPMLIEVLKNDVGAKIDESENYACGERTPRQSPSSNLRPPLTWLLVIAAIVFAGILMADWNSPSSGNSRRSSSRRMQQSYGTRVPSRLNPTTDRPAYRVSTYVDAELNRDKQAIDMAKAKFAQMDSEFQALAGQIDRERLTLDRTSEIAVTRFNQKIDRYNLLLEELREQQRHINQMIDDYNNRLRRHGQ